MNIPDSARKTRAPHPAFRRAVLARQLMMLALLAWSLALAPPARAAADAGAPDAGAVPEYARELQRQADHIRSFLRGELDVEVDPEGLFDLALDTSDEKLRLERQRLEILLRRVPAPQPAPPEALGGATKAVESVAAAITGDESKPVPPLGVGGAAPKDATSDRGTLDERTWRARLELDRARLAFYTLPAARRVELARLHEERREKAVQHDHEQAINVVERAARDAEERERDALEAARLSSTEAARLINEEYARLLAVTRKQAEFESALIQRRAALDARNEVVLGWRRKVPEVISSVGVDADARARADSTYVALRVTLRDARESLSLSLHNAVAGGEHVPRAGEDLLGELPAEVDRSNALQQRRLVTSKASALMAEQAKLNAAETRQLMSEVEVLNRLRLDLLGALSEEKRQRVLGFTPGGWDQATAELLQVALTLRYHLHAALTWLAAIRSGEQRGSSAWLAIILVLKWAVPIALFVWWRRRADVTLEFARQRQREAGRARRAVNWSAVNPAERFVAFLQRVRRPLEWLLLVGAFTWLMPGEMNDLLEARLASTALLWIFGGHFVVLAIDALSTQRARAVHRSSGVPETGTLRLRSLRLVGRAVVAFGLLLSLSDLVVGRGTVYSWVFSTCWFAAIPILLVIISWWRPFIFERFSRMRKANAFEAWVLSVRGPPRNLLASTLSSVAAVAGGVYLFALGAVRAVRGRVLGFPLTRRLLAYLFRRDLSRKAREVSAVGYAELSAGAFRALGPEVTTEEPVRSAADAQIADVIRRIKETSGGAIAIVGERGAGKTTLINRIVKGSAEIISVRCTAEGLPALRAQLNDALGLDPQTSIDAAVGSMDGRSAGHGLLIDDAQYLVRPMMGGLTAFDSILSLFRAHSKQCTWILAFDEAIWRFIERTRGARPLFDEVIHLSPWSEDAIVRLITQRNQAAGVHPDFGAVSLDLPTNLDELELQEAVRRTEVSYYRLLWDYAAGNPGVALHFWRRSLGIGPSGKVSVRLFEAPDARQIEVLPDSAAFVLRAIIQLGWAAPRDIAGVTSLPVDQIEDALRYGAQHGYFDLEGDRYRITWDWFRAVTRVLQRRHLLASAS